VIKAILVKNMGSDRDGVEVDMKDVIGAGVASCVVDIAGLGNILQKR
jgi:hypothetical protein